MKMSVEKKNKLIYSGELILFSVVFLVIGILELVKVIPLSERFQLIYKILTLVGATWMVIDFIWSLLSQKHRKSSPLMDKIMMLPLAIYLYSYDIAGFIYPRNYEYYQIGVPMSFFYIACVYLFQGVYHYYKPIPALIEAIEEEIKEKETKEEPQEKAPEE